MPKYEVGQRVNYYRGWTARFTMTSVIKSVDTTGDEVVYILQDGHWAYEGQITQAFYTLEGGRRGA